MSAETDLALNSLVQELVQHSGRMPWDGIRRAASATGVGHGIVHAYVYGERQRLCKGKNAQERAAKRLKKICFPISPYGLYGYLRVSQSSQAKGNGLSRQREAVTRYCEEKGFPVPAVVFIEEIASAWTGEHLKKKMGRFLELARQRALGPAPHLLMEAVDRFSRMGAQTWDMIHDLTRQ
jgi:Resolvase, N terminal domain